jgi:hypothetical protein
MESGRKPVRRRLPERLDALVDRVAAEIGNMPGENWTDKVGDGVLRLANR